LRLADISVVAEVTTVSSGKARKEIELVTAKENNDTIVKAEKNFTHPG
jgi:hypothetical protein